MDPPHDTSDAQFRLRREPLGSCESRSPRHEIRSGQCGHRASRDGIDTAHRFHLVGETELVRLGASPEINPDETTVERVLDRVEKRQH